LVWYAKGASEMARGPAGTGKAKALSSPIELLGLGAAAGVWGPHASSCGRISRPEGGE